MLGGDVYGLSPLDFRGAATLSGFDASDFVTTPKGIYEISKDVQVYLDQTGSFTTLEKAKLFATEFDIYIDRSELGKKVRIIIAK